MVWQEGEDKILCCVGDRGGVGGEGGGGAGDGASGLGRQYLRYLFLILIFV